MLFKNLDSSQDVKNSFHFLNDIMDVSRLVANEEVSRPVL